MAVLARRRTKEFVGLRPMDPMRDLRGVADLIEDAFADDLDSAGQNALQELRWLSRLKPVLWWMIYTNPEYTDFLSGFVWEDAGKIVGNITINRARAGSRRWLISNLAVAEGYRKRGIARGLMYAALELVKEYSGSSVSLQVRTDNPHARTLYDSLHFKEISSTSYLWIDHVPWVEQAPLPKRVFMRPRDFTAGDAREAYNLACAATPLAAQKEWPLHLRQFRLNGSDRINNLFRWLVGSGAWQFWVVEDGQRFVATVNVKPGGWGQTHKIELTIHPDWRGFLEDPLISRALKYLYRWRNRSISIKHSADHSEAVEVFKAVGMNEAQTLTWMKFDL